MRTRRGVVPCVLPILLLLVNVAWAAAQGHGGITPQTTQCGVTPDNPCLPQISIDTVTPVLMTPPSESGPFGYSFRVRNNGKATGFYSITCISPAQLPCVFPVPSEFSLAKGATRTVQVGFRTLGLGAFTQRFAIQVTGETGVADRDTVTVGKISVRGVPIATHFYPSDGGGLGWADTLKAFLSHPSGISAASFKLLIDGSERPATVTDSTLTASATSLNLLAGDHTWLTFGCAANGRCDSVRTTFSTSGPATAWELDDSLPPPEGHGIEGLLGGLPLPPTNLLGCPMNTDAPEIRLVSPTSFLSQPGSGSAPGGLVFAAAVAMNDTLRVATATIDFTPADGKTCDLYGYLPRASFDWGYWQGSDQTDTLWRSYPYSDSSQVALGRRAGELDLAAALPLTRSWARSSGSRGSGSRGGALGLSPAAERLLRGWLALRGGATRRLPSPGAIKPSTFRLTLNGTVIVSGSTNTVSGVTVESVSRAGASVKLPGTHPLLHRYDPASPSNDNGGWNELVATISDSTNHTTSVRARFVQLDPGLVAPLALAPLRDLTRLDQGECAAFGVFQCGGVMLTQTIPGFVSRDKDRSLHLVYRSASQRAPAILPIQVSMAREQKAPDSLRVVPSVGGVVAGDTLRYAGTKGAVSGVGSTNLWENADEIRIVGAQLDAQAPGSDPIQQVTTAVRGYYTVPDPVTQSPDTVIQDGQVIQEVVRTFLTDTLSTRFGQGWQLAELGRLILGDSLQGAPAAIWLMGDGSHTIFRKLGTSWTAPAGVAVRLVQLATITNNARYVLYLDGGASIGFRDDGWQVYTADLLGNRTNFNYLSSTSSRLTSIVDPGGQRFVFQYFAGGAGIGQVKGIQVKPTLTAGDTAQVANLAYAGAYGAARLTRIEIVRSPTQTDATVIAYRANTPAGAYVDSIVDPRSTTSKPVVTRFTYDSLLLTPESVQRPPDRFGSAVMSFRDPWRRAVPRLGKGRLGSEGLERMVYPNQLRGTALSYANRPTDFRVDPFGNPTQVVAISDGVVAGGFYVPSSAADDIRDIERDSLGRVAKIVHGRNLPETADSVMYRYDALGRVDRIVRNTAQYPTDSIALDTISFSYDSVTLAGGAAWCSRLLTMTDPMGGVTRTGYGTSGAGRCLPTKAIGLAADTTLFTYGSLTAGTPSAVRPVSVRDPNGLTESVAYDPTTWNTASHTRLGDNATSRAYYDRFGRPDSLVDAKGIATQFLRDRSGRVTHQRTGHGSTSPVTRTIYDPGGLAIQTDVYAAPPDDLTTPSDSVQSTRRSFNQAGELDSLVGPGPRTPTTRWARKQSWQRDRFGVPMFEYPGNGSYVARATDWQGRVKSLEVGYVDPTRSLDGERFALPADSAAYAGFFLTIGPNLSAGQVHRFIYDSKGRRTEQVSTENYRGQVADRRWGYSRAGALVGDTLLFQDGATVARTYDYNRRGQRIAARSTVTITTGTLAAEPTDQTLSYYNGTTARLDSVVSATGTTMIARAKWAYDRGGRVTDQWVAPGVGTGFGVDVRTTSTYDAAGRPSARTTQNASAPTRLWYQFASPSYNAADQLRSYSAVEPGVASKSYAFAYDSTGGTGRLTRSETAATVSRTYGWVYDVFGNRAETFTSTGGEACQGTAPLEYGPDNRLVARHSFPSCSRLSRYWSDQAGNRLGETDTLGVPQAQMTYTAASQLYYSLTPTVQLGTYDYNWHWYDGDGRRILTQASSGTTIVAPRPETAGGILSYYVYDGSDVALVLARQGTSWWVKQRPLVGGVDAVLAGRYSAAGTQYQNLALVADRQGSTVAAVKSDGSEELSALYPGRNAFGALEGASAGGGTNTESGYTGASTPNQTGGFTYLRNRWYDPATGRFLTQDPIGLAGGVNLYAYAGNDPVQFSDPFGLAPCGKALRKAALLCALVEFTGDILARGSRLDKRFPDLPSAPGHSAGEISERIGNGLRKNQGFSVNNPPSAGNTPVTRGLSSPKATTAMDEGIALGVKLLPLAALAGGAVGATAEAIDQVRGLFPSPELGHVPVRCRVETCDGVQEPAEPPGGRLESGR